MGAIATQAYTSHSTVPQAWTYYILMVDLEQMLILLIQIHLV